MTELPLTRRRALAVAGLLLAVLLLAGKFLLHSGRSAEPAPFRPVVAAAPKPRLVVVDVVGAVRREGLQQLPEGSRIADALARAGGATTRADLAQVNLAAPLADGEQVVVPTRGKAGAASAAGGTAGLPAGPVHLSTATLEQLDALPGIGPVTAQKILAYRQQHGAFSSIDELDAISGIGPARIEQLKGLVAP